MHSTNGTEETPLARSVLHLRAEVPLWDHQMPSGFPSTSESQATSDLHVISWNSTVSSPGSLVPGHHRWEPCKSAGGEMRKRKGSPHSMKAGPCFFLLALGPHPSMHVHSSDTAFPLMTPALGVQ